MPPLNTSAGSIGGALRAGSRPGAGTCGVRPLRRARAPAPRPAVSPRSSAEEMARSILPVNLAAGLADAGLAAAQRGVVAQDAVGRDAQEVRVAAQEAARVDVGQADVELVALELLQVLAADLRRLGRLADGYALLLAGLLKAFSDGLHVRSVAGFAGQGKNDLSDGSAPSQRVQVADDLARARAVLGPDDALLLHDLHDPRRAVVADPQPALEHRGARAPRGLQDVERP